MKNMCMPYTIFGSAVAARTQQIYQLFLSRFFIQRFSTVFSTTKRSMAGTTCFMAAYRKTRPSGGVLPLYRCSLGVQALLGDQERSITRDK
jgi:hypothetical protein